MRVKSQKIRKTKLTKMGKAVLRLIMPIYFKSAGLVVDAYQQTRSHKANPKFTINRVWLKRERMNVAIFFNDAM